MNILDAMFILLLFASGSGISGVACLLSNSSYTKLPAEILTGSVATEVQVNTQLKCAAIANSLSSDGYSLTRVNGSSKMCSVFSSISGKQAVGEETKSSYVTYRGSLAARGIVLYNDRFILTGNKSLYMNYTSAIEWCQNNNATVFVPKNTADWNFMTEQMYARNYGHMWIPMTDEATEGEYVWFDGSSASGSTFVTWGGNTYGTENTDAQDCVAAHDYSLGLYVHADPCSYTYNGIVCQLL